MERFPGNVKDVRCAYLRSEVPHVEGGHGVVGAGLLASSGLGAGLGLGLLLLHRCCHFHLVRNIFWMVSVTTGRVLFFQFLGVFLEF